MPVGIGDIVSEEWKPTDGELTEGDEHSITITPDSESYVVNDVDGEMVFGEKGAPVTVTRAVRKLTGGLSFGVIARVASSSEEVPPPMQSLATLSISVKNQTIN